MAEQKIQLPAQLGKYVLEELLSGGLTHVYRARDTALNRTVAVKILSPAASKDKETKARFLREARMAGNLAHPNVISVFDFGEEQGRPYMVMEYLQGEDLLAAITNGHTGDLTNRIEIALQIAKAFEAIHAANIIHRDLKPENIQVCPGGVVKLVDFGLAKSLDLSLTRPGFALGTPYYMAPEQVLGQAVTGLVDIYAFGLVLYELITGAKANAGGSIEGIFRQIIQEPLNLEPLKKAAVPQNVTNLIVRCTAKKPADRIQSFADVRAQLERILHKPAAGAPSLRIGIVSAVVLGVIIVLLAVYAGFRRSPAPPVKPPPAVEKPQARPPVLSTPTGEMALVPGANFYIDLAEVTNDAYAKFCKETARTVPRGLREHPGNPVSDITIIEAQSFARRAGKRLPTGQEWDQAAQSLTLVVKLAEFVDESRRPTPAALKYFSAVLGTPTLAAEPWYSIRGAPFHQPVVPARYRSPAIGFRCAKSP